MNVIIKGKTFQDLCYKKIAYSLCLFLINLIRRREGSNFFKILARTAIERGEYEFVQISVSGSLTYYTFLLQSLINKISFNHSFLQAFSWKMKDNFFFVFHYPWWWFCLCFVHSNENGLSPAVPYCQTRTPASLLNLHQYSNPIK